MKLKPLREQVIVLTGGTSGIGLATARAAARRGARLVIAARGEEALKALVAELEENGSEAAYVVADVGREEDVEKIRSEAIRRFGGFDTWINGVGISIYGRLDEVSVPDMQRLFDTNFWSQVYGSRAALSHFRERRLPAKLINIGSVLGERAIPMQGIYAASKHAVAGFTEALRMEIDAARIPVSVTLIKPSAINTPYKEHAKNYMKEAPQNPPPVYDVQTVSRAIVWACEHDRRDMTVGGGGRLIVAGSNLAPGLADRVMARTMPYFQRSSDPAGPAEDNSLYRSGGELKERSPYPFTLNNSAYTQARMHPIFSLGLAVGAVAVASALAAVRRNRGRSRDERAPARAKIRRERIATLE